MQTLPADLAIPYCGAAPAPGELMLRWNLDPALIAGVALAALAYLWLRKRCGGSRDAVFAAGFAALVAAFVSPLCAWSSALFAARTVHHGLIVAVAAPLLIYGLPRLRRGAPPLALATLAHAALFWIWHAPAAYAWALSGDAAYWLMQACLLGSAAAFWLAVRAASPLGAAAALLGVMTQMGLLAAVITFATRPLYAPHLTTTWPWGLSPLADQQLAGVIMWAPMAGLYLAAALVLAGRWLRREAARGALA